MSYTIKITTFETGCTDKEQAVKVLEEAAEVFSAWEQIDDEWLVRTCGFRVREHFEDEIADCIEALSNLAARYEVDLEAAMIRCDKRNRERGRL